MTGAKRELTDLSADQYRALIERTSDVISVVDEDGTIRYQSPSSAHVKGWASEDLVGENILEYIHPEDRSYVVEEMQQLTGEVGYIDDEVEFRFQSGSGEWIWLAITGTAPGPESPIEAYITTSRDITERVEYENELERYKKLVENVPVGIFRSRLEEPGELVEVNPGMATLLDVESPQALLGAAAEDFYVDPDERDSLVERAMADDIVREEEIRLETLAGEHIRASMTAIVSEVNGTLYFDGIIQDVTERKEAKERLKAQRDDLELLNQVVRHDIRNDLQVIGTYAEVLEAHVDGAGREHLETLEESVEQAVDLTKTARDLSEVLLQSDTEPEPIPLGPTLENALADVEARYPNASMTLEASIPDVQVLADEMLESVFLNVLQNAVQHNDKDDPEVEVSGERTDGSVVLRFADNGPGIPDGQKETIFGRGEKGLDSDGTGIGLYLVRELVTGYDGAVRVEDNEPDGSVFVVELPTADTS